MRRRLSSVLRWSVFVLPCVAGCVSETRGPTGEVMAEAENDGPMPLEAAENRVRAMIAELPREAGQDLLGTLERITAYREIALRPIRDALVGADARSRSHLVYVLGRIGGPEAHRIMTATLADKDPVVRFESAAALLDKGDLSGVPVLIASLRDQDRKIRFKSIESLKRFTKKDFGYDFAADEAERTAAAGRWDAWWAKTRAELIYVGNVSENR
jgi:hypothetical protein